MRQPIRLLLFPNSGVLPTVSIANRTAKRASDYTPRRCPKAVVSQCGWNACGDTTWDFRGHTDNSGSGSTLTPRAVECTVSIRPRPPTLLMKNGGRDSRCGEFEPHQQEPVCRREPQRCPRSEVHQRLGRLDRPEEHRQAMRRLFSQGCRPRARVPPVGVGSTEDLVVGYLRALWQIGLLGAACAALSCSCHRAAPGGAPASSTIGPEHDDAVGAAPAPRGSAAEGADAGPPSSLSPETLAAIRRFFDLDASIAEEKDVEVNDADGYDIRLSARTQQILPDLKRASREAVRHILADSRAMALPDDALSEYILQAFRGVKDESRLGGVRVQRQPEHPDRIGVVVSLGSPFGSDDSVYVFEARKGALPELEVAIEENGYDSITGAQYALSFAISPPDEHGDYFVVEAHTYPWLGSLWRSVHYRVFAPTGLADAPKLLLDMREDAFLRNPERIASVEVDRTGFTVEFLSRGEDPYGAPYRGHIRHYVRSGTDFVRTQPVVAQALDLPDEWLRLPWSEAQRWTKSSTSLERWHTRLRDPQLNTNVDFKYKIVGKTNAH